MIFHNLFKSKPKVQFFTLDSAVQELQPIIKASDYKPKWWNERAPKYIMEPNESRLIIFPSYIKHKVTKHMNQDVRISISGDYLLINKQS